MDKNNKLILAACAVASFYLLLRYSALIAMLDIFKESRNRILESQNQQEKEFEEARNGTQALFDGFKKRFDNNLNRFQKDFKVRNRPDNFTEGKSKKDIVLFFITLSSPITDVHTSGSYQVHRHTGPYRGIPIHISRRTQYGQ